MKKILSIFLMILVLLSSCKTKKQVQQPSYFPQKLTTEKVIEQLNALDNIQTAEIKKMNIYLKMKDREFNVTSSMTIKKDSAINISIQPFFGMELFKLEITPNNIFIFDKVNQTYYTTDFQYLNLRTGLGIDFYHLQALLTNRYFCLAREKDIACSILAQNNHKISFGFDNETLMQTMSINPDFNITEILLVDKINNLSFNALYENYALINGIIFPRQITYMLKGQKHLSSAKITIDRVKFNQQVEFIPTDTRRYKKGSFDQLFKK